MKLGIRHKINMPFSETCSILDSHIESKCNYTFAKPSDVNVASTVE